MTPRSENRSDTKLLLLVAAAVATGAIGIALVAGLTVQRDSADTAKTPPAPERAPIERPAARTIVETTAQPASLVELADSTIPGERAAPVQAESETDTPPEFEIDLDADPWREGNRAYHNRQYAEALAYLRADAAARPERAYTHYMLGLALWKSGELDQAVAAMQRSAEINDASIRTFVNLSRIQNARGEYGEALAAAERALLLDADSATAVYQKARSLYNLGRIEEARAELASCIELDHDAAQAHNLLGLIRLQQGDDTEALAAFEIAARLEPAVSYIHNNLGLALERSGRLSEAVAAFRRAVEIDPEHEAAALSLARVESLVPAETAAGEELELATSASEPSVDESPSVEGEPVLTDEGAD